MLGHGMPRLDVLRDAPGPRELPQRLLGAGPRAPGAGPAVVLGLRARLAGGGDRRGGARRGSRSARSSRRSTPRAAEVAICMATYEPPLDLLPPPGRVDPRADPRGLDLRGQRRLLRHRSASPRCSEVRRRRSALRRLALDRGGSASTATSSARSRWRRPERGSSRWPTRTTRWHPDKLETLRAELGGRPARLQRRARDRRRRRGCVADTYWSRRRNNHARPALAAGRELGDRRRVALPARACSTTRCPFPPAQFAHFHDHWLALCALAPGEIDFVDRPLYDYVQHGGGDARPRGREPDAADCATGVGALRRDPRERVRLWRMHYFVDACRLLQFATVLELRCGDRMPAAKRRALERVHARGPVARRRSRGSRRAARASLAGAPGDARGGVVLSFAFAWRRALGADGARPAAAPAAARRRAAAGARPAGRARGPEATRRCARGREDRAARLAVRDDAPAAGEPADPDDRPAPLLRRLHRQVQPRAAAGRARRARADRDRRPGRAAAARTGGGGSSPTAGSAGLFDRVEVAFGRESPGSR